MILMCLRVVILGSSLSHSCRNVKHPDISFSEDWHRIFISLSYKYAMDDWQYLSDILYCLSITTEHGFMSVVYSQAQKQRYRITLDLEVMDDFDPHQINWEDLFEMEGSERVIDSYVEDLSRPVRWWLCGGCWHLLSGSLYNLAVLLWGVDVSSPPWYDRGKHQWNDSVYAWSFISCVPRCPYIKKVNYPNLQRWQIDLDI